MVACATYRMLYVRSWYHYVSELSPVPDTVPRVGEKVGQIPPARSLGESSAKAFSLFAEVQRADIWREETGSHGGKYRISSVVLKWIAWALLVWLTA